ncbi:hypothetical protein VCRA2119O147_800010 [Vibrio crassostreae]|nr:hypothetical protein VCRA2119O47_140051 [Vibrio crassostreae]CAK1766742.1 hypothetical protein VCRA2119O44_140088 [Vibrio crassostreae]CAK1811047.1 hypothetical protein VCRA2110O113_170023 [Vibrio crassostreae]CAK1922681.1 hypothetical protein VCRA2119O145_260016 [Vibrio crassostreae]CAK1953337.1 hypothetical protein VCRA2118O144_280016 [Vibrio crassostreae]
MSRENLIVYGLLLLSVKMDSFSCSNSQLDKKLFIVFILKDFRQIRKSIVCEVITRVLVILIVCHPLSSLEQSHFVSP